MSTENEGLNVSDSVRSFIQKHFDEGIDLRIKSNRTEMQKKFQKENPNFNQSTVRALFSQMIPEIGKAYNYQKEDLTRKPPTKYDKSKLGTKITKKPSDIKTVGIKNPKLDPNQRDSLFEAEFRKKYQYEIKDTQITAFCDSLYGLMQLIVAKDLDDLTEQESSDLGDLWQPIAQDKLGNSAKGQAALAVGGTSGIILKKVKKAKEKRKIRLEKESKEKPKEKTPDEKVTEKVTETKQ